MTVESLLSKLHRLQAVRLLSRHSKAMNQRCSESNGLPKDEDSKLKKEEEKEKRMQAAETYITSCHRILSRILHFDALMMMSRLLHQDCQACSANLPVRKTCGKHAKCIFMTLFPHQKKPALRLRY
jgi:hypothetical protein